YLFKCGLRAYYLLSPVPNFYRVSALQYAVILVASLCFFHAFLAAALVRLAFRPALTRPQWLLLTTLSVWILFHVLVNASIRNRLPADFYCAALAISLWTCQGWKKQRSFAGASPASED